MEDSKDNVECTILVVLDSLCDQPAQDLIQAVKVKTSQEAIDIGVAEDQALDILQGKGYDVFGSVTVELNNAPDYLKRALQAKEIPLIEA